MICIDITCSEVITLYCLLCLLTKHIVNKYVNYKMLVVLNLEY